MKVTATIVPEVLLIEPKVFGDRRGKFCELWDAGTFARNGISATFVKDNYSLSTRSTLRGLHFQVRHGQGKLVRVLSGKVFDVAVDLRRESPTFGRWVGLELSAENLCALWIPPGFAHGFYVLSETAEFLYKCTDVYAPEFERTLIWNDPHVNITWPAATRTDLIISDKDAAGRSWDEIEKFY